MPDQPPPPKPVYSWPTNRARQVVPGRRERLQVAEASHQRDMLPVAMLPQESPDLEHDGPDVTRGRLIWQQSGWDISVEQVMWLKEYHGIEWSGGEVTSPRPTWVDCNTSYWWCLCCGNGFSSICSVHGHCQSKHHWKNRQNEWERPTKRRRR